MPTSETPKVDVSDALKDLFEKHSANMIDIISKRMTELYGTEDITLAGLDVMSLKASKVKA